MVQTQLFSTECYTKREGSKRPVALDSVIEHVYLVLYHSPMIRTHKSRATNGPLSCGVRCKQRRQPPVSSQQARNDAATKYITGDLPPPDTRDTTGDHHLPAHDSKPPPPAPKAHAQKHTPDRRPAHHGSNTLNTHTLTHTQHTPARTKRTTFTQPQEKEDTHTP